MRVYLAGPMSGHAQFNFPLFNRVADRIRDWGISVVSPAELDRAEVQQVSLASVDGKDDPGRGSGETWGDFLARDVKLIADEVDAVAVMPEWWTSRGARLEVFVAMTRELPVCCADVLARSGVPQKIDRSSLELGVVGYEPSRPWKDQTLEDFKDRYDPEWRAREQRMLAAQYPHQLELELA